MSVKSITPGQEEFVSLSRNCHAALRYLSHVLVGVQRDVERNMAITAQRQAVAPCHPPPQGKQEWPPRGQPAGPPMSMSFFHIEQLRNDQQQLILRKRGKEGAKQGMHRLILPFPASINEWVKDWLSWTPSS